MSNSFISPGCISPYRPEVLRLFLALLLAKITHPAAAAAAQKMTADARSAFPEAASLSGRRYADQNDQLDRFLRDQIASYGLLPVMN